MASSHADAQQVWDVVVAGAGPAGLTTALAVRAAMPHASVTVLERARTMRPCGGNIGLISSNIWLALRAIGPEVEAAVLSASLVRNRFITMDKAGNVTRDVPINARNISWYDMQQALLSQLPAGAVQMQSGVQTVERNDDGTLRITTATGGAVRGRVLVGCDGNRSEVRRHVNPAVQPRYVGASAWRFFMQSENPFCNPGERLAINVDGRVLGVAPAIQDGKEVTYCSGISGFPECRLAELNQTRYIQAAEEDSQELRAKLARFKEAFAGYYPKLVDYITAHAVPESCLEHPIVSVDPSGPWHRGTVALCGDAAHAMPPNFGQGFPQALEDSVQLAASLQAHGLTPEAMAHYEAARKERLLEVWEASTSGAIAYYQHGDDSRNPYTMGEGERDMLERINAYAPPVLGKDEAVSAA